MATAGGGRRVPREILYEFSRIGSYLKVTAMDPDSLVEVSVSGPANGSREVLRRIAANKLIYVLNKGNDGSRR